MKVLGLVLLCMVAGSQAGPGRRAGGRGKAGRMALKKVWHPAPAGGDADSCGGAANEEKVVKMSEAVPSSACTKAEEELCFCVTKV